VEEGEARQGAEAGKGTQQTGERDAAGGAMVLAQSSSVCSKPPAGGRDEVLASQRGGWLGGGWVLEAPGGRRPPADARPRIGGRSPVGDL